MLVIGEVGTTNHGDNLPGFNVLGHESRRIAALTPDPGHTLGDLLLGQLLLVVIQGGDNLPAALQDRFGATLFNQLLLGRQNEPRRRDASELLLGHFVLIQNRHCLGGVAFFFGDLALFLHEVQDVVLAGD